MRKLIWTALVAMALLQSFHIVCEAIPKDSLVLYIPMDEGQGDEVEDKSGHGNDGVIFGNPNWVVGISNSAIEFDGVDDFIEVQDSDSLNPIIITIIAWIKLGEPPATRSSGIIAKWAGTWSGYLLQTYTGHAIEPLIGDGSADFAALRGLRGAKQDVWYHTATVWDGKTLSLYIDGEEADYDKAASAHEIAGEMKVPPNSLLIGKRADTATFKGVIDEVMIFNEALSLEEIRSIMQNGLAVESHEDKLSTTWAALKKQ